MALDRVERGLAVDGNRDDLDVGLDEQRAQEPGAVGRVVVRVDDAYPAGVEYERTLVRPRGAPILRSNGPPGEASAAKER
jgi:hypothetical protein